MSRFPGCSAEILARRAAANAACSRGEGGPSGRSAHWEEMYCANVSDTGVVDRFEVARGAVLSAMSSILHPAG